MESPSSVAIQMNEWLAEQDFTSLGIGAGAVGSLSTIPHTNESTREVGHQAGGSGRGGKMEENFGFEVAKLEGGAELGEYDDLIKYGENVFSPRIKILSPASAGADSSTSNSSFWESTVLQFGLGDALEVRTDNLSEMVMQPPALHDLSSYDTSLPTQQMTAGHLSLGSGAVARQSLPQQRNHSQSHSSGPDTALNNRWAYTYRFPTSAPIMRAASAPVPDQVLLRSYTPSDESQQQEDLSAGHGRTRSISKMPLTELYGLMELSHNHTEARRREEHIMEIIRSEGFDVGYKTWIRDTNEPKRKKIIGKLLEETKLYGYDSETLEIIVRRGTYARMQSRLRQVRRHNRRVMSMGRIS